MIHLTLKLVGVICDTEPASDDTLLPLLEREVLETEDLCAECRAEYEGMLRRILEDLKRD